MIGKELKAEKPITLAELKEILKERKKEGELTYEQKVSAEYAKEFGNITQKQAEEAIEKIMELGVDDRLAVKIVNLLPETKEELKLVFEKARYSMKDDQLQQILDIITKMK